MADLAWDAAAGDEAVVPTFSSLDDYIEAIHRLEPWQRLLGIVASRVGMNPSSDPVLASCCNGPVAVYPEHIVKLYQSWNDGQRLFDREVQAYQIMARDDTLPAPRLVAHGRFGDNGYVVTEKIPGVPLRTVQATLDDGTRTRIARFSGHFLRRLHALPLTTQERANGLEEFRRHTTRARVIAGEKLAAGGHLPPRLLDQLDTWLPSTDELLGDPEDAVLLHGGFKDKHIFVTGQAASCTPSGVIDFNSAAIGAPMAELPLIWRELRTRQRQTARAFLDAAELPGYGSREFAPTALAWSLIQRHPQAWAVDDLEQVGSLDELAIRAFDHASAMG